MTAGTLRGLSKVDGANPPASTAGQRDEGIRTGLSIILADAVRSHLAQNNLQKAPLCLQEAERCMASLITS